VALFTIAPRSTEASFEKLQTPGSEVETDVCHWKRPYNVSKMTLRARGAATASEPTDYEQSRLEQSALSEVEPEGGLAGRLGV